MSPRTFTPGPPPAPPKPKAVQMQVSERSVFVLFEDGEVRVYNRIAQRWERLK